MNILSYLVILHSVIIHIQIVTCGQKELSPQRNRNPMEPTSENLLLASYLKNKKAQPVPESQIHSRNDMRTLRDVINLKAIEPRRRLRNQKQQKSSETGQRSNYRHSTSQGKQFKRLMRQLSAKNFTSNSKQNNAEADYATVIEEEGRLPMYVCPVGKWACPTPKRNLVTCIDISKLCDYRVDCPKADDENPVQCAFYRQSQAVIEAQNRLISSLENQIQLQQRRHLCELNHMRGLLFDHSHSNSLVKVSDGTLVDYTCGAS